MNEQMKRDEHFMAMAIEEGRLAFSRGSRILPVGAVAVLNDEVIAFGRKNGCLHHNLDHPERNVCELMLLTNRSIELRDVTVYTNLEPCIMCFSLMVHLNIQRIVYSLEDSHSGGVCVLNQDSLPTRYKDNYPRITAGVLREMSLSVFGEFFRKNTSSYCRNENSTLAKLCLCK